MIVMSVEREIDNDCDECGEKLTMIVMSMERKIDDDGDECGEKN